MTSDEFYENFKKQVAEQSKKIKIPKDISQDILYLKAYLTKALEDSKTEGCYTGKMEFGFSERMVNYIIQIAYEKGRSDSNVDAVKIRESLKEEIIEFIQESL